MTGAWERTTRTTFYLQAEEAASMHCPALGEASTLTAGARLHVGYDSRTALTWSVAPVGWPALEAFGRLGLCLISEAVGVDPELIRALNGVRAEEEYNNPSTRCPPRASGGYTTQAVRREDEHTRSEHFYKAPSTPPV